MTDAERDKAMMGRIYDVAGLFIEENKEYEESYPEVIKVAASAVVASESEKMRHELLRQQLPPEPDLSCRGSREWPGGQVHT